MKKGLTTLLVILLAVGAMLVSCKAEVATPADELVSVSFEMNNSRSLTATLESFAPETYYWKYAAKKDAADTSGLTSGATSSYDEAGAVFIHEATPGLTGKVPGFSQGLWDFLLFGYKKIEGDNPATTVAESYYYVLIYSGEAKAVTLQTKGDNTAHVVVNPVAEGDGYIEIGTITFIPKKGTDKQYTVSKFIEVTNPDGSAVAGISYDADTQTYTVPAGAYKVTVKFANASQTIIYGEGYVIATVYPNLTTKIAGDLSELVTYAQFDADLNPDAVNVQAKSAEIQYGTGADVEIKTASTAEKQVKTSVARSDANAIIEAMAEEQGVDTGSSTTLKLTLNVDPTDATETTVTYEIGMKATLTYTKDTETQTSEKAVTALEKYVVVEIEMSSGLSDVNVRHSGTPMFECASKAELDAKTAEVPGYSGFFFYDATGTLYIKTKNFSPFAISYTAPANYVASVDGVKYGTLAEAVAKVKSSSDEGYPSTVTLLADVALTSTVETTKTFTLDLAGYDITAANCRAIHVQEGTLTLTDKGTIAAGTAVSTFGASSSVIRVGDNAGTAAGLVIGKDVTISSSYCYGVSIFGTETEGQTLVVNGKIKVTGTASAISGNGSDYLKANTITINKGAEVYAENDYAIYHPQRGTLTVEGGTIAGKGGIEAKGGNVIVNGGAITATAPTQSHEEYNNGASTSGYALAAVKNPNYPGDGSIRVNDGMITGKLILATDEAASFTTKLEVAGGLFTEDPIVYVIPTAAVTKNSEGYFVVISKLWSAYADDSWYSAAETVYEISTPEQLAGLLTLNNSFAGKTIKLTADINLYGKIWDRVETEFTGTFDGNGHTISNMLVNKDSDYGNGFFRRFNGTIKYVTFDNARVQRGKGLSYNGNIYGIVAGYAGYYATATFDHVTVKNSSVKGFGKVGAIAAHSEATKGNVIFTNCVVDNVTVYGVYNCGGLIGLVQGDYTITNCDATGATWSPGNMDEYVIYENEVFKAEGFPDVSISGAYWKYGDWIYAGWGDLFCDYYFRNAKIGPVNYSNGTFTIADGRVHNVD